MSAIDQIRRVLRRLTLQKSASYWERRYRGGGDSGWGSSGELAQYKANVINEYVEAMGIRTVLEFGCGDGRQLVLARYPRYHGVDVSATAVDLCRRRFSTDSTKAFTLAPYDGGAAELCLSLDVVYHLIEDRTFDSYMTQLFRYATTAVIVYSSNFELTTDVHVRHRAFTTWVDDHAPGWRATHVATPFERYWPDVRLRPDFWLYERRC